MITKINLDGYRLLNDFEADLNPLTVVIGANASGKSTLIDGLRLVRECCEYPINTALGRHGGAASVLPVAGERKDQLTWKIEFQKPMATYWNEVPLNSDHPLSYEVELKSDAKLGLMHAQKEVLRNLLPAPGYTESLKLLEATPYRRQIFDRTRHRLVPFDMEQSPTSGVQDSGDASSIPAGTIGAQRESALLLSQILFFNELPVQAAARFFFVNMAFYPGFDVTRSSALRTKAAEISPLVSLEANGGNLGTVLHDILTRYDFRATADELQDFLRVAYPTFEAIHCDTTHGTPPQVLVGIREKGLSRSMYLWDLSDGMLRFLCLAMALLNPIPPSLVAIDEPELGLHPGLLPIVAEMIKAAAERTQVLVTTHSPELLDCFGIDDIAVITRDENEAKSVWHRPSNRSTLVRMLENVTGDTLGDLHRSGELEAGV